MRVNRVSWEKSSGAAMLVAMSDIQVKGLTCRTWPERGVGEGSLGSGRAECAQSRAVTRLDVHDILPSHRGVDQRSCGEVEHGVVGAPGNRGEQHQTLLR